jgi:hypothetical protein
VTKIPAQQQLSFFRHSLAIEEIGADVVKSPAEELVDIQLAVAEFGPNAVQKRMHFAFGQSHNAGGNLDGALIAHQTKRAGQHMRAVRVQSDSAAGYIDLSHCATEAATPAR